MPENLKTLMIQGTGSGVGKSVMVAGLLRVFSDMGFNCAPFKAQNMALNSFVTRDGCEMGRSQAVQAFAAKVEPTVLMNPALIKPKGDVSSQLILNGKPYADVNAVEGFGKRTPVFEAKLKAARDAFDKLRKEYELIVIEGAGSPAEVNLAHVDMVNMPMAEYANAPVIIVADIDRGGVFASLIGTMECLEKKYRKLVKGFIFNRFRGDASLLKSGIDFLYEKTGVPVLGVVPYLHGLRIEQEDSVPELQVGAYPPEIDIAIIYLQHVSNFTDFDALALEPGVGMRYVWKPDQLGKPDVVIIPGTKNSTKDLLTIRESGMEAAILNQHKAGVPIVGVCGGYQMMGKELNDPLKLESGVGNIKGLGLLDLTTTFNKGKTLGWTTTRVLDKDADPFLEHETVIGYEIHSGETELGNDARPLLEVISSSTGAGDSIGAVSKDGLASGTYLHDLFKADEFRRSFVDALRQRKGLGKIEAPIVREQDIMESEFDRLAYLLKDSLDIHEIIKIARG